MYYIIMYYIIMYYNNINVISYIEKQLSVGNFFSCSLVVPVSSS